MELDDFKTAWQSIDRRLEQQHRLELDLYRDRKLDRMRGGLRPLLAGQIAQVLCGVLLIAVAGVFWASHRAVPSFLISGVILHVYGILLVIFGGRTIDLIRRIDYASPVVLIQKQLGLLRRFYIQGGLTIGLAWWLLWIPLVIMVFGFLGADVTRNAPSFVYAGMIVGIAGLAATVWLHRLSQRAGHPRLARFMDESFTGASLVRARRFVEEIEEFERE